jgi:hypothetical protein
VDPPLRSTRSGSGRPSPFAGFSATMKGSDFSSPCITGFGSSPSRCGPVLIDPGRRRDLPVPAQGAYAHAGVCDRAGPSQALALARPSVLPSTQCTVSASRGCCFRGSIPSLCAPLSTLRRSPLTRQRLRLSIWQSTAPNSSLICFFRSGLTRDCSRGTVNLAGPTRLRRGVGESSRAG